MNLRGGREGAGKRDRDTIFMHKNLKEKFKHVETAK